MVCAWRVRRGSDLGQLNFGPSRLTPTEHWQEKTSWGTLVTSQAGKVPAGRDRVMHESVVRTDEGVKVMTSQPVYQGGSAVWNMYISRMACWLKTGRQLGKLVNS
jgi:hypothetical protein